MDHDVLRFYRTDKENKKLLSSLLLGNDVKGDDATFFLAQLRDTRVAKRDGQIFHLQIFFQKSCRMKRARKLSMQMH